jgi:3-oxoacyl-[acyl-carrier-protein] synthase II
MDQVAVTGDGCISALGWGVAETLRNLYGGRVQPPLPGRIPANVPSPPPVFCVEGDLEDFGLDLCTRTTALAMWAARDAIRAAWPGHPPVPADRIGVCLGTTVGCTFDDEAFYREFRSGKSLDATSFRRYRGNDISRVVADAFGFGGPSQTVVNACASGADAIGEAAAWIRTGRCDAAVAGGADALCRFAYLGFIALKNTSRERCRPFDRDRKGLNLGEGAGVVVLERETDARRRGAALLARVAGHAAAADAYHPTAPHPEGRGLRRATALALATAGVTAADVAFVNAHGTGTSENDRVEGSVVADLYPEGTPVFSTKGYTGHTTGAAGAIEAILTARNLLDRRVPASAGFETPDPACRVVPTTRTTDIAGNVAVSNSLAFGGGNSVLVIRRGEDR